MTGDKPTPSSISGEWKLNGSLQFHIIAWEGPLSIVEARLPISNTMLQNYCGNDSKKNTLYMTQTNEWKRCPPVTSLNV